MTRMKVSGSEESRTKRDSRVLARPKTSAIGMIENLETRELLSSFQPVSEKFQWVERGTTLHEIQFDASGACTRVINPQQPGSNDCSLDQFGTPPDRIVVNFNTAVNKKSFNLASDASVTGDVNPADPFRITAGVVSKKSLLLSTQGGFATGPNADVT